MGQHSERSSALDEFDHRHRALAAPGRTLIVGSRIYDDKPDRRKLYDNAVGVDMLEGPGVDVVANLEEPDAAIAIGGYFSHIECTSVLEHSRAPWRLAAMLVTLLLPGGTIYITAPFVWRVHAYPSDYFRFTREGIRELFGPAIQWQALEYAHLFATTKNMVPSTQVEGHPFMARTEVCGFGRKV